MPILEIRNDELLIECDSCRTMFTHKISPAYMNREFHFCSSECLYKENRQGGIVRAKIEKTNMDKYGVPTSSMNNKVKQKMFNTNIEKYGDISTARNKDVKQKAAKTCIERYGHVSPLQSADIQQKSKETCLKNNGVEWAQQSEEIRLKTASNNLEKYGVENVSKLEEIKIKSRQTCLEHYGVEYSLSSPEIREKGKQTLLEKYGVTHISQSKEVMSKIDFKEARRKAHETMKRNKSYGKSKLEDQLFEVLVSIFGEIDVARAVPINSWLIDFRINSRNLYIQFDGVYWHGLNRPIEKIQEFKTPRDKIIYGTYLRDVERVRWFKEHGIQLLRIFDKDFIKATTKHEQLDFVQNCIETAEK